MTPFFTIITSTYNAANTLARLLDSLAAQTFRNFEIIVQDGASKDATLAVVESYRAKLPCLVVNSAPDKGIYDAWNSALAFVSGEWVLFLGADDALYAPDTLEKAFAALKDAPAETLFAPGDALFVSPGGVEIKILAGKAEGAKGKFAEAIPFCHTALFQRARVFRTACFDSSFRIAGDYEFLCRTWRYDQQGKTLGFTISRMAAGGISSDPVMTARMRWEVLRVLLRHHPRAVSLSRHVIPAFKGLFLYAAFSALGKQQAAKALDRFRISRGLPPSWEQQAHETDTQAAGSDSAAEVRLKASVLMPVYNDARYIRDAIDSILNQTFAGFEFVIVNDGSTDGTAAIVNEYADPRIKIITHERNLGRPSARNSALQAAQGEYVFWMDADDIALPQRLEKQIAFMDAHPDVAVCGGAVQCFHNSGMTLLHPSGSKAISAALFFAPAIANPACCIRKSVLDVKGIRFDDGFPRAEDYEFWCRLLLDYKQKAGNIPDLVLLYRVRAFFTEESHKAVQCGMLERLGIAAPEETTQIYFELSLAECGKALSFPWQTYVDFADAVAAANGVKRIFPRKALRRRLDSRLARLAAFEGLSVRQLLSRCVSAFGYGRTAGIVWRHTSRRLLEKLRCGLDGLLRRG
ncbi:Glycosyl transferase family 2 (modular protein) [uncultured delta proteobacterium]|uniref:Glycosyl transferase family 2 (Modular protein) n=1 Tax=uncultured delta proteobacterium TaxID=34034 RepID=A0A212KGW2_9DELT|nr:Glycosyl transferase family 2 (modular protein) [uncultured delta proteobacterium]